MPLQLPQFLAAFQPLPGKNFGPDKFQTDVISHGTGPLWVAAGPGSGKTDSMVLRTLKILSVDDEEPKGVFVTTFTEKAARNLEERILRYAEHLKMKEPSTAGIDPTRLRVGTLHGLASDIMQEFRFTGYQNFRLLNDMEQRLFIMEHSSLAAIAPNPSDQAVWDNIACLASGFDPITNSSWKPGTKMPNKWMRARGAQTLFNRIVEEQADVNKMLSQGGHWQRVAEAYIEYRDELFKRYRCDFAHLQVKFLEFLQSSQATPFLKGDGSRDYPGINHVIVDEYQDTNPIQEEIYLRLAAKSPHNLSVVGDDDQALYRFRGGTVDSMVNFDRACKTVFGASVAPKPLPVNYRSHTAIVAFCDGYIRSFPLMAKPGARAPNKQPLQAGAGINGAWPAVSFMSRKNAEELAEAFADHVEELRKQGTIQSYSDCVLLLHSTRDSKTHAGPFMEALENKGIKVYNPRGRALLEEDDVQTALGAFLEVVDPDQSERQIKGDGIRVLATKWRAAFHTNKSPALDAYVQNAQSRIKLLPVRQSAGVNMLEVLYHIFSYAPFDAWTQDPNRTERLGLITQVFESFSAVPRAGSTTVLLGDLNTSDQPQVGISKGWRKTFYYSLLGVLAGQGLNETEDEDATVPPNHFPIMTVHQAKGLQFPIVFVSGLTPHASRLEPGASVLLEQELRQFRTLRYPLAGAFSPDEKTQMDLIRFYYVAYSRAQYALTLLATSPQVKRAGQGFGGSGTAWFNNMVTGL